MRLITNEKTYRTTCPNCGAEIEYNLNDIKHSYNHGSYIICPNVNCHNSFPIKNEDDEREQAKEKERKNLAKSDEERIQKEYEQLAKDIKHHYDTYNKIVDFDAQSYDRNVYDRLFRSDILHALFGEPFFEIKDNGEMEVTIE